MRISVGNRRPVFFAGIVLFGLLAMTARNAVDPDLWWHLSTGQQILETGHIPRTDSFSFTRAGQPWVAHEWLSEVILYGIWRHAGAAGLIIFSAAVTTAGFLLLYLRCPGQRHWAAAATVLGALASAPAFGVRPQMFTFALASLLLWLVERGEDRPWLFLWIPPLFLVWLNLHAGFAIGPALLLARGAGLLWEVATGETAWQRARPHFLHLFLVFGTCMALVPLNPSGAHLYGYPLNVVRSAGMRSFIVEWFPPDFHLLRFGAFLCICLVLLIAFARSNSRPKARTLAPLLGALLAALDAVRHIPIFALLAIPVIAAALPADSWRRQFSWTRAAPVGQRLQPILRSIVVALLALFAVARWNYLIGNQNVREATLFPQKAFATLRSRGGPRELFAYYDWGGYAIWKLYPASRVFVDGRADLYGDELLDQFKTAVQLRSGWQQVLESWQVRWVLVPPTTALAEALSLAPGWHTEYRDAQAVLFFRQEAASGNGNPKVTGIPPLLESAGHPRPLRPFPVMEGDR